jgi:putative endonuclease
MAGLVPAISIPQTQRMRQYCVYILASRPGGAIYVGVTGDPLSRVAQHKQGLVKGNTKRADLSEMAGT